jgi:hypothetical protein
MSLEEYYIEKHGRNIKGYCVFCGAIRELDDSCQHDEGCLLEPEGPKEPPLTWANAKWWERLIMVGLWTVVIGFIFWILCICGGGLGEIVEIMLPG